MTVTSRPSGGGRRIRAGAQAALVLLLWLLPTLVPAPADGPPPGAAARAQVPDLPFLNSDAGDAPTTPLPEGVEREGLLETAPVRLDGKTLFRIASPTVTDRNAPGERVPVEIRAAEIASNLNRIVQRTEPLFRRSGNKGWQRAERVTRFDPETLTVRIATLNDQPVLLARDAEQTAPNVLMTVTDADAAVRNTTKEALAQEWRDILERELRDSLAARQPAQVRDRLVRAAAYLTGAILVSILLGWLTRRLNERRKALEARQEETQTATAQRASSAQAAAARATAHAAVSRGAIAAEEAEPAAEAAEAADRAREEESEEHDLISRLLQEQFGIQRQIQVLRFLRWLTFWAIAFIWVGAISAILYDFPATRAAAARVASTPILILVAWFTTGLVNGLLWMVIDRVAAVWGSATPGSPGGSSARAATARASLRVPTVIAAIKGLVTTLIYLTAVVWVLQSLRIVPATVIALGAIIALAVSFAAQSLVKDLVNGFLILLEDQYALGDVVTIGPYSGAVEKLNLRITQLRGNDGRVVTIPNSAIVQVENQSRVWARANLRIDVAYATDVDHALEVIGEVSDGLAAEPEWAEQILDPRELLGVDDLSSEGITIALWVRTVALKQWGVARELRRRLKIALDREGIVLGAPVQVISRPRISATAPPPRAGRSAEDGNGSSGRATAPRPAPYGYGDDEGD
jgi:Small-conductance mechanosensitive channel